MHAHQVSERWGPVGRDGRTAASQWLPLALNVALVAVLNFGSVGQSALVLPAMALCYFWAFTNCTSAFFVFCANQHTPFPDSGSVTPAEIAMGAWLLQGLISRTIRPSAFRPALVFVPWMVWVSISHSLAFGLDAVPTRAVISLCIALNLTARRDFDYSSALVGVALGCSLVGLAFWYNFLGLPVDLFINGSDRQGFQRIGGVRADSVTAWPNLLLGMAAIMAMGRASLVPVGRQVWAFGRAFEILWWLAFIAMTGTMTHGGWAAFGLLLTASVVLAAVRRDRFPLAVYSYKLIVVALLGSVLWVSNAAGTRDRASALFLNYQQASEEGVTASRSDVWSISLSTILSSPAFGVQVTQGWEDIPEQYTDRGYYLSHNIFLDAGRQGGLPALVMLGIAAFWPLVRRRQFGASVLNEPGPGIILMYTVVAAFWMVLSFFGWQPAFAVWALARNPHGDQSV